MTQSIRLSGNTYSWEVDSSIVIYFILFYFSFVIIFIFKRFFSDQWNLLRTVTVMETFEIWTRNKHVTRAFDYIYWTLSCIYFLIFFGFFYSWTLSDFKRHPNHAFGFYYYLIKEKKNQINLFIFPSNVDILKIFNYLHIIYGIRMAFLHMIACQSYLSL